MTTGKKSSKAEEIIHLFLTNESLPNDIVEMFQGWLASEDSEKEKDAVLKEIFDKEMHLTEEPSEVVRQIIAEFNRRLDAKEITINIANPGKPFIRRPMVRVAAVLLPFLVIAGAAWFTWNSQSHNTLVEDTQRQVAMVTLSIAHTDALDAKSRVMLDDGSHIFVCPGTEIEYAEDFGAEGTRTVSIKGEAYFDVVKDTAKVFTVETKNLNINVLGTTFDIEAIPGQPYATVTLFSGRIIAKNLIAKNEQIFLLPGDRLKLNNITGDYAIEKTQDQLPEWIKTKLNFKQSTLDDILTTVGWYYGVDITKEGLLSKSETYTFRLSGKEDLDTALSAIGSLALINYEVDGDTVMVKNNKQ